MTTGDNLPARHERPVVDEAALAAARHADLRRVAQRARAAYGPKDSIREVLPADLTEPFLADLDRLLKALAREALESRS
ncbi:MAG: hypothetical protein ABSA21_09050 [Candidatus Limnocylindrales bacterium]